LNAEYSIIASAKNKMKIHKNATINSVWPKPIFKPLKEKEICSNKCEIIYPKSERELALKIKKPMLIKMNVIPILINLLIESNCVRKK
jgi:hypothetical protein